MSSSSVAPIASPETVATIPFSPGQNFQIQRYRSYTGDEPLSKAVDRHIIVQVGRRGAHTESRGMAGNWLQYKKGPGSLTLAPSGLVPDLRLLGAYDLIACALEKAFVREVRSELDRQPVASYRFQSNVSDASIGALIGLIISNYEEEMPPCALYAETLAHALAMRFILFEDREANTAPSSVSPLPPRVLRRIRDLIEAELKTDLSLATLAKESGYSRSHFIRMFRAATGLTPHQYVLERRLSAAKVLLRESKVLLADIALKCGFSSQTHMSDAFRKHLGFTPKEYRNNSRRHLDPDQV